MELRPCPFCGSANIAPAPLSDKEWYTCRECSALSGDGGIDGWNTRIIEDALLEAAKAALDEISSWPLEEDQMPSVVNQLRAAIAKTEGEG